MKLFFTVLLLVLASALKAQQLNTLEYYFDTDPGYGNGSHLAISGTSTDADYSLTMPALSAGLHSMYMRIRDNVGVWGTTYQQLVFINNGTVGASSITTAEYFFDIDPGFGNGTQLALSGDSINTDVNFNMGSLPAGSHTLYLRLKNNSGAWSTVYQSTVFINAGSAGNTNITAAEYYFDTDPGVGKATTISLNNNSLDSNLILNTTGLSNGTHTLVIRLKNNNNAWSTSYENDVNIYSGIDSIPQITSLEIFNDTDKGINKNTIIPLTKTALLDTTFSVFIPDNGKDNSTLGLRLHNQAGQTGNVALQDVSLCDLYKPEGGFRSTRYGGGYNFIDSSSFNPSKQIRWMVNGVFDTAYNNSAVFNYSFSSASPGHTIVSEVTGSGCRVDTSNQTIVTNSVESFSPEAGYLGHDYVMNIFGAGFDTTTVVYLQLGSNTIYSSAQSVYLDKLLTVTFDLHNVTFSTPGLGNTYDLHVHFANGKDSVLINRVFLWDLNYGGFDHGICFQGGAQRTTDHRPSCSQLIAGAETFITTELTGARTVKTGVWNYYTVNATNTSGVLAKCPVIWIMIPADNEAVFDVDYYIPAAYDNDNPLPTEWSPIDTIINGQHYQYKLYSFIPAYMAGGETRSINFKLRSNSTGNENIYCWAQKPMFGSPPKAYWNCAWDVLGYVPYISCVTSVYDWATSKGGTQGFQNDRAHGNAYNAGRFFASYWYNTGSAIISCSGGKLTATALKKTAGAIATIEHIEGVLDKELTTINNGGLAKCTELDYKRDIPNAILHVAGFDPNHLTGNSSYDDQKHFIDNLSPQHYEVGFENLPAATAKTQHVYITDTLDANKFDFSTFRYTSYRIADSIYSIPPFRNTVFQTLGIKGRDDIQVLFVGSFDTLTGIIRSDFFTLNATGSKLIADTSLDGFLPPNIDGVSGTGSVQFQVSAKDLNTLDTFTNVAHVYFDNNQPIKTNFWMNTVDTTAPKAKIVSAGIVNDTTIKITVQKSDVGAGFWYTELFVKTLSDTVFHNLGTFTADTVLFVGAKDSTYQFYTKGVDNVGNEQVREAIAEVTVVLLNPLPLKLLSFTARIVDKKTQLNWTTTNEVNTDRFEVERSTDGQHFTKIGVVPATNRSGANNYASLDNDPATGENYYRLKQYDIDGNYTYSKIIKLYYSSTGFISIAPNPAKDFVDIQTSGKISQVLISDVSGKKVKTFSSATGNRYSLTGISKGLYLLQVMLDGELHTFKLVVE